MDKMTGGVWELREPESGGLTGQEEATLTSASLLPGQPCDILGLRTLSGRT